MEYRMIEAGEERMITEEAIEIIGSKEDFEVAKEGISFVQDDIEIFFKEL